MSGTIATAVERSHPLGWGYIRGQTDFRDWKFSERRVTAKLPPINPRPDVRATAPFMYDQGMHGTCVTNAVGARLHQHAIQMVAAGKWGKARIWAPSRLAMYWWARQAEGTLPLDNGCMVRTAIRVCSQSQSIGKGVCPERHWTYPGDTPEEVADPNSWAYPAQAKALQEPSGTAYRSARLHQITDYRLINNTRRDEIMQVLTEGRMIPMGFMCYRHSLFDRAGNPKPVLTMPQAGDYPVGGHATCIVAANDSPEDWDMGGGVVLPAFHFLHQNSWGRGVQMGGYFAVPFDYDCDPQFSDDFWDVTGSER